MRDKVCVPNQVMSTCGFWISHNTGATEDLWLMNQRELRFQQHCTTKEMTNFFIFWQTSSSECQLQPVGSYYQYHRALLKYQVTLLHPESVILTSAVLAQQHALDLTACTMYNCNTRTICKYKHKVLVYSQTTPYIALQPYSSAKITY